MKKLLPAIMLLLSTQVTIAQPVLLPNGDFENWSSTNYDTPQPWITTNQFSIPNYGIAAVTKIAGFGSTFGVRLETKAANMDTFAAFVTNSIGDLDMGQGGVPFSFKATHMQGMYRYNIASGDTAYIIAIFKKNGIVISDNRFQVTGSQSTATQFNFPLAAMAQTPDSVIIAALSSNAFNGLPVAGSWLELDMLAFDDGSILTPAPNGDFENWTAQTHNAPNEWTIEGSGFGLVNKTTDKYSGTYAIELVSEDDGSGFVAPATIRLNTSSGTNGMPFTKLTDTLTGYYKYSSPGNDSAMITVVATDANGAPMGSYIFHSLAPAANYTYFEIPVSSSAKPARLTVEITSSSYMGVNGPVDGSTLIVDKLELKNTATSINAIKSNSISISTYPNPAGNILYIKPNEQLINTAEIQIFDITGKQVHTQNMNNNTATEISLEHFTPGLYHYRITSGDKLSTGKVIKK